MRKLLCILALGLLTAGFYSCETETDIQETEALFQQLDQNATDGDQSNDDDRSDDEGLN
ncbi:hypothetical protein V1387_15065 [Allomuricauda taeanensis]|uniref:hypothetical protein n=1 Tax=Flavobacteriaceae TaxID=49546 RepID=UPI0016046789|nr:MULTISPECIES: hypothetical protein [Allomuricauda]MDC6386802.1 hypothetical protein [Muricauda sp. SK9]MEE1964010.1 hypothetical protein [Allomuricauda taeanensis]